MTASTGFSPLEGQQYISLATFRKSGEAVPTPVWFALADDRLYIVTQQDSGKVKRIRNNPQVTMTPSDGRGQITPGAPTLTGEATVIPREPQGPGDRALRAKYGWMYSAFGLLWRLRRITPVIVEVRPSTG
jgi:uncharacterized protein